MSLIPKPIRQCVYNLIGPKRYEKLRYFYYKTFVAHGGYDQQYYQGGFEANSAAYELLARTLTAEFQPKVLVDVGCGNGGISSAFLRNGCSTVLAFDGSVAAVEIAKGRGLTSVRQLDFIEAAEIPAKGDLCICCEVAEHIPEAHAAHLCELLSKPAPILAFTAAPPGQGGHLHVNLQPQSWWIALMARFGMEYDGEAVQRIRAAYGGKMLRDYDENLMVFRRK